jgi:hypothetical protein
LSFFGNYSGQLGLARIFSVQKILLTKGGNVSESVVIINLGSPKSPDPKDVRPYLQEFLMDPYVVDLPWFHERLLFMESYPGRALRNRGMPMPIFGTKNVGRR